MILQIFKLLYFGQQGNSLEVIMSFLMLILVELL